MLYIGLPALWSLIMSWAGIKGGQGLSAVVGQMKAPANTGGCAMGNVAMSATTKRIT